jgi:hypothetical protein
VCGGCVRVAPWSGLVNGRAGARTGGGRTCGQDVGPGRSLVTGVGVVVASRSGLVLRSEG